MPASFFLITEQCIVSKVSYLAQELPIEKGLSMTEPKQTIDHLEYDIDPEERDAILEFINEPGGDRELKRNLQRHSPDEVDAMNLERIRQQMIHARVIFPHH